MQRYSAIFQAFLQGDLATHPSTGYQESAVKIMFYDFKAEHHPPSSLGKLTLGALPPETQLPSCVKLKPHGKAMCQLSQVFKLASSHMSGEASRCWPQIFPQKW